MNWSQISVCVHLLCLSSVFTSRSWVYGNEGMQMDMKQIGPQATNEAADFNEQRLWAQTGENLMKSSVKRPDKHEQMRLWKLDMFSFTQTSDLQENYFWIKYSASVMQVDTLLLLAAVYIRNIRNNNNITMENKLNHMLYPHESVGGAIISTFSSFVNVNTHRLVHCRIYQSSIAEHRWIVGKPKCCANHVCLCLCYCL